MPGRSGPGLEAEPGRHRPVEQHRFDLHACPDIVHDQRRAPRATGRDDPDMRQAASRQPPRNDIARPERACLPRQVPRPALALEQRFQIPKSGRSCRDAPRPADRRPATGMRGSPRRCRRRARPARRPSGSPASHRPGRRASSPRAGFPPLRPGVRRNPHRSRRGPSRPALAPAPDLLRRARPRKAGKDDDPCRQGQPANTAGARRGRGFFPVSSSLFDLRCNRELSLMRHKRGHPDFHKDMRAAGRRCSRSLA
jgi:hypothetical protein